MGLRRRNSNYNQSKFTSSVQKVNGNNGHGGSSILNKEANTHVQIRRDASPQTGYQPTSKSTGHLLPRDSWDVPIPKSSTLKLKHRDTDELGFGNNDNTPLNTETIHRIQRDPYMDPSAESYIHIIKSNRGYSIIDSSPDREENMQPSPGLHRRADSTTTTTKSKTKSSSFTKQNAPQEVSSSSQNFIQQNPLLWYSVFAAGGVVVIIIIAVIIYKVRKRRKIKNNTRLMEETYRGEDLHKDFVETSLYGRDPAFEKFNDREMKRVEREYEQDRIAQQMAGIYRAQPQQRDVKIPPRAVTPERLALALRSLEDGGQIVPENARPMNYGNNNTGPRGMVTVGGVSNGANPYDSLYIDSGNNVQVVGTPANKFAAIAEENADDSYADDYFDMYRGNTTKTQMTNYGTGILDAYGNTARSSRVAGPRGPRRDGSEYYQNIRRDTDTSSDIQYKGDFSRRDTDNSYYDSYNRGRIPSPPRSRSTSRSPGRNGLGTIREDDSYADYSRYETRDYNHDQGRRPKDSYYDDDSRYYERSRKYSFESEGRRHSDGSYNTEGTGYQYGSMYGMDAVVVGNVTPPAYSSARRRSSWGGRNY